jgi:microcystin degradation protein MlrC
VDNFASLELRIGKSIMTLRVAVASLMQETNSFSPLATTLQTFENHYVLHGDEILTGFAAARVEMAGVLSVLREAGAMAVPLVSAYAAASGPVIRSCFDALVGEIETRLRAAGPVDGLLLALHGSLVVEDEPDGDGEIIERMRRLIGAVVPIGVSLDLHAHVVQRMLQPNVFLIGYQEYPHVDMYETGQRIARLLLDAIAGRRRPVMALAKRPMIISAVRGRTTDGPLRPMVEEARRMEATGEVLHASLFPVQPWIDVPELGFAVLACADGDAAAAERAANKLADMTWERRHEFEPDLVTIEDAIRIGLSSPGTTIVSDPGDAPTSGSAADNATVLRALLAAGAASADRPSFLTLCDPRVSEAACQLRPGARLTTCVGHCFSRRDGEPVPIEGTVRLVSNGEYRMRDSGAQGMVMKMGLTSVIAIGAIQLLVRSRPAMEWDTGMYLSQGLDPREAALVFVKSPAHFRVGFAPMASRILVADTPGPSCTNLRRIPWKRVTRPLFPLDPI